MPDQSISACSAVWETSTNPLSEDALDSCILLGGWSKSLSDRAVVKMHCSPPFLPYLCSVSARSAAGVRLPFYLQGKEKESKRGKES